MVRMNKLWLFQKKGGGRQKKTASKPVTLHHVEEGPDCSVSCKKADVRLIKLEVRLL